MTLSVVESRRIKEATLHVKRPLKKRGYVFPFVIGYGIWMMLVAWLMAQGKWDELWYVPLTLTILVHGLALLSCHWSVRVDAWLTCRSVHSIDGAQLVKIIPTENSGKAALVPIEQSFNQKKGKKSSWIHFQRQKFVWDEDRKIFRKLHFPIDLTRQEYIASTGLDENQVATATNYFGLNKFDMPLPTFWELFKEHAVAPFFVFQVFCVALWCLDEYWYYSVFTLIMLIIFESTVVQQRLKNMAEFRTMSLPSIQVKVRRGGVWKVIKSEELVPGDVVCLQMTSNGEELILPCDLVLVKGTCIINEAMISGESTPLLKESLQLSPAEMKEPLDLISDRNHLLFGGTKVLQITLPALDNDGGDGLPLTKNNNSQGELTSSISGAYCQGVVLRTGFGTMQGKLVRTMMFSSERMTANNVEAFAFILFLLIFALAAAGYVLYYGWDDPSRSRIKLLLECTLIITAVVPPELPMELSLAVNNSLLALSKFAIYCMEPFRIPWAGKLDVCCFDKTGTLTGENLVVEGVAGLKENGQVNNQDKLVTRGADCPMITTLTIATCHGLFRLTQNVTTSLKSSSSTTLKPSLNNHIVGDPMEKTALEFVNWTIGNDGDVLVDQEDKRRSARILHRFPFSSALKRMSCIIQVNKEAMEAVSASSSSRNHGSGPGSLLVTCKGAPEVIEEFLKTVPSWYRETYAKLAHRGARVLALAYRPLSSSTSTSPSAIRNLVRDQIERDLIFAGFLVFHCPLKKDSHPAITALINSLHHVVMITGDNVLTAVHTAYELCLLAAPKECAIVELEGEGEGKLKVSCFNPLGPGSILEKKNEEEQIDGEKAQVEDEAGQVNDKASQGNDKASQAKDYSRYLKAAEYIAITGDAFIHLSSHDAPLLDQLLAKIVVFARASPSQKENILTTFKTAGLITLMCGDGTNDVGALKQAHVGVALLDGKPEDLPRILHQAQAVALRKRQLEWEKSRLALEQKWGTGLGEGQQANRMVSLQERIHKLNQMVEEEEATVPMIRLGDASVAAPFTSKISTIDAVINIVRQGRCTLVTTMQMYKILALNSLISAYGLSVLHGDGIRYGDFQVTITGMLLASCFLFLSKSKPVDRLAPIRPQPTIFNWYVLMSVLGQFLLHVIVLWVVVKEAGRWSFRLLATLSDTKFTPNLVNTAIYLVSLLMQVSTFLVNYQGHPFRESLGENRPLRNSLLAVGGIAIVAALELYPEFNEWLQLVPMPPSFKWQLVAMMAADLGGCLAIEWACKRILFDARPKIMSNRRG